jgi:hypothetical protein
MVTQNQNGQLQCLLRVMLVAVISCDKILLIRSAWEKNYALNYTISNYPIFSIQSYLV